MTKAELRECTSEQLAAKLEYARQEEVNALNKRNRALAAKIRTQIRRIEEVQAERA